MVVEVGDRRVVVADDHGDHPERRKT